MKTSIGFVLSIALIVGNHSWAGQPSSKEQRPSQQKPPVKVQPSQQQDQQPKTKHPLLQPKRRQFV